MALKRYSVNTGTGSYPDKGEVVFIISSSNNWYDVQIDVTDSTWASGDDVYIQKQFDITTTKDTDGNAIDTSKDFRIKTVSTQAKNFAYSTRVPANGEGQVTKNWVLSNDGFLHIILGTSTSTTAGLVPEQIVFDNNKFFNADNFPRNILIGNKYVTSIKDYNSFEIENKHYSFNSTLFITEDEVKQYVEDGVTWSATPGNYEPSDLVIKRTDYSSMTMGASDNTITMHDYTFPAQDEYSSAVIEFQNDFDKLGTSNAHLWLINTGNFNTADKKVKILTNSFADSSVKSGENWLYKENQDPRLANLIATATIDSTRLLKGLNVTLSKSTGIKNGETITATVMYDSTVADNINGKKENYVVSNIAVVIKEATVTKAEVAEYVSANIQWPTAGTSIAATYRIENDDYTSMTNDSTLPYAISVHNWDTKPTKFVQLVAGESIAVTFKEDISIPDHIITGIVFRDAHDPSLQIATSSGVSGAHEFKTGETWIFEYKKDPVKAQAAITTSNLDITKWPALHPGTKLYTPDLHMVGGKEITLTVQADHGYTVNGVSSVDYQYTPINDMADEVWYSVDTVNEVYKNGVKQFDADNRVMFLGSTPTGDWYAVTATTVYKNNISVVSPANYINDACIVGEDIYFTSGGYVYKNDQRLYSAATSNISYTGIASDSNGSIYYGANNRGIYKDGAPYAAFTPGSTDFTYYMSISPTGVIYARTYTDTTSIYKLENSKATWTLFNKYPSEAIRFSYAPDDSLYVGTSGGKVFKDTTVSFDSGAYINSLVVDENSNVFIGNDNKNVYKNGIVLYSGTHEIDMVGVKKQWGSSVGNWK